VKEKKKRKKAATELVEKDKKKHAT